MTPKHLRRSLPVALSLDHALSGSQACAGSSPADDLPLSLRAPRDFVERGDSAPWRNDAGGAQEPQFVNIFEREAEIAIEIADLDLKALRQPNLLSVNAKTTVSLDFPIGHTCHPTPLCAAVCYASRPGAPAAWKKSLRKRLRNLRYFQLEETGKAIDRLSRDFARKRRSWAKRGMNLDFLRVNGTGDLFPAIVPVLNGFAARNPNVRVWIVTRRFELAALIEPLPNVFLQLSLDATTRPALEEAARKIVATNARAYLSFLRTEETDDTRGAAIVFNEKGTAGLPYDRGTDCPVDAGRLPLGNERGVGGTACAKCRKCFTDQTLARQHGTLEGSAEPSARLCPTPAPDGGTYPLVHTDGQGRLQLRLTDAVERAERQGLP